MSAGRFILGAVAYDPKVVTIWEGFRHWFRDRDLDVTYVLHAHYEHQVEDLMAGRIDVAWNSPLAWIRAQRLAKAAGASVQPLVMRDSDCDLSTAIVVRAEPSQERSSSIACGRVTSNLANSWRRLSSG